MTQIIGASALINVAQTQIGEENIYHKMTAKTIGDVEVATFNAKEVHEKLGVGKAYTCWIKQRIMQGGFEEGIDYVIDRVTTVGGDNPKSRKQIQHIYYLTLEMGSDIINRHKANLKMNSPKLQEHAALTAIETVLNVIILRQFRVMFEQGYYIVDGYDADNNIVYEVDEKHHTSQVTVDTLRQSNIENVLGCKFVRIIL